MARWLERSPVHWEVVGVTIPSSDTYRGCGFDVSFARFYVPYRGFNFYAKS